MESGSGKGTPATTPTLEVEVDRVRRMTDELTETTYTDEDLRAMIQGVPLMDERGEVPYTWDTSTSPPTEDENEDWIPTYDLASVAADVWGEKAAIVAQDPDFSADGGSYKRSQVVKQYAERARYYRSRRAPRSRRMFVSPKLAAQQGWVGNLAEEG